MWEIELSKQIKENIQKQILDWNMPEYMGLEIRKILDLLNYYKLSNLNSNINMFKWYIEDLSDHYHKEIDNLYFKHLKEDPYYEYDIEDRFGLDCWTDIVKTLQYYLSPTYVNKFIMIVNDFVWKENLSKWELTYAIQESLKWLDKIKIKVITFLTLKLSEFVHNPTRATAKVQNYFITNKNKMWAI